MSRASLGGATALATAMGIVGAVTTYGEGSFTIASVLVVAALGSIAIHAVLSPQSYRDPRFSATFYRVWAAGVPVLAVAALITSAVSPGLGAQLAYWSGFAAIALFSGAVVDHRSAHPTVSSR